MQAEADPKHTYNVYRGFSETMQPRFIYTPDFEKKIETALSTERLDSYREALGPGCTFDKVIRLYNANTALSEALLGPIQAMEISVRNSICQQISKEHGNDWYLSNSMNLEEKSYRLIEKVYKDYRNKPQFADPKKLEAKIVSELTLGFWSNLFKSCYEDPLWRKCLRNAFPHVGGALLRNDVFAILDKIRRLRNRIGHHEQIILYNLEERYNNIIDIISWVSPITAIWLSHHNRFYDVRNQYKEEIAMVNIEINSAF
ncbi:MAG TPA: Abi family protein [Skermanella sp.]|nr:Abi family protein [Skermanella sp.]